MSRRLAAAALLLCLPALSACMTPRVKPTPSTAVVAAPARAGARPASCQVGKLEDISPVLASFPFDDATLDAEGGRRLAAAAAWVTCTPGVPVVIIATADNRGDDAHRKDLTTKRAQAALAALRAAGAKDAVVHTLAPGAPDPIKGPHLIINADGRGW